MLLYDRAGWDPAGDIMNNVHNVPEISSDHLQSVIRSDNAACS